MDNNRKSELDALALEVRKDVVRMVGVARSYGLASSLSVVDLLVYLYWEYMQVYPRDRNRAERDRLVLSKSLATSALYACLARLNFFSRDELWSYRRLGATLQGYPDVRTPGVDAPSGSHGGGVGIASGLCLALRMDGLSSKVFCILGDGELQAGVAWESIFTAAADGLGNLVVVVDANAHQDSGPLAGLKNTTALAEKFDSFGWYVTETDGHDFPSLEGAFSMLNYEDSRPKAILAKTYSGRGISHLQQAALDTTSPLSNDDMDQALSFLESETRARGNSDAR